MTKHDAVTAFFQPKAEEQAGQYLEVNNSDDYSGISLVTNYSDKLLKKYLWGSEKEYGFSIIIVQPYSTDTDDLNLTAMNFAQAFMDWLEEQNKKRNYPEFPNSCQIKKMETLQNMPNLAGVNVKEGMARYMVQCRIVYFEKGDKR